MGDDAAVKKRFSIALDISRPISNRAFTLVEGDTGNELCITLSDDGEPVDLTNCRVMVLFSKSDGTTVSQDSGTQDNGVCLGGENGNEVTVALFASSFSPGMVECELQVYSGAALSTLVTSAKFNFRCRRSILNPDTLAAVPDYPLLTSLLAQVSALEAAAAQTTSAAQTALDTAQAGEVARSSAENVRASAETVRASAETVRAIAETVRASAENARAGAETERGTAELAREDAELSREAVFASLTQGLDSAAEDAEDLIAFLETALYNLPAFASVSGILKGNGSGSVTSALANSDYYEPPLRAQNLTIPTTSWASDETCADFPYAATVTVSGAADSMVAEVVFAPADAVSGMLAPVAESVAGGIILYAAAVPQSAITIKTLTLWKGVAA